MYKHDVYVEAIFDEWKDGFESGNLKHPNNDFFKDQTAKAAHDRAVMFFKLLFDYLKIPPEKIVATISKQMLEDWKLNMMFKRLIFPPEYVSDDGYSNKIEYLPKLLYPELFPEHDLKDEAIWAEEYAVKAIAGELGKKMTPIKLTTDHKRNREKIAFMFNDYLKRNPVPDCGNDIEKMYKFFTTPAGKRYVKQAFLLEECQEVFNSPLDLFHESLSEKDRNYFLYQMYEYEAYKEAVKALLA